MNIISLTGNLGRDNEVKQLSSGTTVLNNSIGVRSNSKVGGNIRHHGLTFRFLEKVLKFLTSTQRKGRKYS